MLFMSVRFDLLALLTNLTSVHSLQISTLPVLHQSLAVYSVRITKQTVMMMMMNYLGAVYVMEMLYWDAMVVMMTCIVEDAISKTYLFSVWLLLCIHQFILFPFIDNLNLIVVFLVGRVTVVKITKTMIYQSTGLQERKDDIINHLCINFTALMQRWNTCFVYISGSSFWFHNQMIIIYNI